LKYEVDADPQQVVQILEGIERVADLLGINASAYGITITVRKGLFRPTNETYVISYSIVRAANNYVVTFRLSGGLEPIARADITRSNSGCRIYLKCLGAKQLCRHIDDFLKKLVKNLDTAVQRLQSSLAPSRVALGFKLSSKYNRVIDGLAEVTLSSLYLKYPLLDKRVVPIDEVKDIESFLDKLYMIYRARAREIYVHISASSWMFIVAVDLANMEYTPSFISDNVRVVGKEAIEMFKSRSDPYVSLSILSIHS